MSKNDQPGVSTEKVLFPYSQVKCIQDREPIKVLFLPPTLTPSLALGKSITYLGIYSLSIFYITWKVALLKVFEDP